MRIDGHTQVIAHLGHPTHSFKAPLIYNPYFAAERVPALVVPMDCRAEDFEAVLRSFFRLGNALGALVTMPHKRSVMELLDELTPTARAAGACNAVKRLPDGRLLGDQFDGEGFVLGVRRKGVRVEGAGALVVGCGGVGSPIAASLAAAGVKSLVVVDVDAGARDGLIARLREHFPLVEVRAGDADPAGFDIVVNATPLGMEEGDPLPFDVTRLSAGTFVGEVVMRTEMTPLLRAAQARGCRYQVGTDMLFEMIPAYLRFFGLPVATPERLRALALV